LLLPSFLCRYLRPVLVVVEVERGSPVAVGAVDEVADRVRSSRDRSGRIRVRAERIDDDLLRALDLRPAERAAPASFGILK
jgi:hypothetical protein